MSAQPLDHPDVAVTPAAETLEWPAFMAVLSDPRSEDRWRQGEHVGLVGPTGRGKTTLALEVVRLRKWVALLAMKPKDATLNSLRRQGWVRIRHWPPPALSHRVVLHTPITNLSTSAAKARPVVADALQQMYEEGSWCIVLDDLQAMTDALRIGSEVKTLLLNGRAMRISVVASTQRPVWVPREVWANSTHLFLWGTGDDQDLRALGGLGVAQSKVIRAEVTTLGRHQVLYVNTRTGRLIRTQAPKYGGR